MNLDNIKMIRSNVIELNQTVYMTLYRVKEILLERVEVKLISKPLCETVADMSKNDRYVFEDSDKNIYEFKKNTCEPYFLITRVKGNKEDSKVNARVKFEHVVTEKTIKIKKPRGRPRKEK